MESRADQLWEEGDLHGSLPWLVESLALCAMDPVHDNLNRVRIGAALRQSPTLVQAWFDAYRFADISADGRRVLGATSGKVRIWDATSGAIITTIETDGLIQNAELSPDGTRFVTRDSGAWQLWDSAIGEAVPPSLKDRVSSFYSYAGASFSSPRGPHCS